MYPVPPPPVLPSPTKPLDISERLPLTYEDSLREVLRGCEPFLGDDTTRPERLSLKHLQPFIQDGPTCGLVALGMLAALCPRNCTVAEILEDAQALGYTRSGEMFSVQEMADLSRHVVGDYFRVEVFSDGLAQRRAAILEDLLNLTALYLVPYDTDKDHSPACLNGHKAHWALLCGAVVCKGTVYVLARQGKSRHIGVWSFDQLDKSNSNLIEISPQRLSLPEKYIFHDLRTKMAGQYIKFVETSSIGG